MISARGLLKTFSGFVAVDNLSFEVEPGEIYGLLGPNGAGKTTTTRLLTCLLRPTSGTALVAGHSIAAEPHLIRGKVGILTEVPGLYERLTADEYLMFFAEIHELPSAGRRARVEEMLRLVGMWDQRRVVMRTFSKGMQQRVAIARALLHDPQVLFFDEPTAALDPEAARSVRDHLRELARERRRTVLLCTHNLHEAELLCRRVSVVRSGRQIAEGTPTQLKARTMRRVSLSLRKTSAELLARLSRVSGVLDLEPVPGDGCIRFRTSTPQQTNPEVIRVAVAVGADVLGLAEEAVSLEEVYLSLVRGQGHG